MNKYITRKIARIEASKLKIEDVRKINCNPYMCYSSCLEWKNNFGNWIESAYNEKSVSYEEMAEIFNSDCKRKFSKSDGTVIDFCGVLVEYLNNMCLAVNRGKRYTVKQFNAFMSNYNEM